MDTRLLLAAMDGSRRLFTDLSLRPTYHKGQDDIALDFYVPILACASSYDRAVGFFSSAIYSIAWPSVRAFAEEGGSMRLLCSPVLTDQDIEAMADGHAGRTDDDVSNRLAEEVRQMLVDPRLARPTRVLAGLVAAGILDIKIAFLTPSAQAHAHRIFHDKLGILSDRVGNRVAFKGSMNETWNGLAADGNLESVDVYVSWAGDRESLRIEEEAKYFQSLWDDQYPTVRVRPFPEVARDDLISAASDASWQDLVDEICGEMAQIDAVPTDRQPAARRSVRPHQKQALEAWEAQGRRGILKHATGSGKTFTALSAIREALERGEVPVILVPSELLLTQWQSEIVGEIAGAKLLVCGGGNDRWRSDSLLRPWTRARGDFGRVVLSTMQTAVSPSFVRALSSGQHIFLVADEVHRLGSPEHRKLLELATGPRLGLSATPERAGDPEGTDAILDYFEGIVPPAFTLRDGIEAGLLTPYMYYVHTTSLLPNEQEDWARLTKKIGQAYAVALSGGSSSSAPEDTFLQQLLIQRARIVKQAAGKVGVAVEVARAFFKPGEQWIVYCDSQGQLAEVLDAMRGAGLPASEYHTAMVGDRQQTLRHFALNGGLLVSIRCLDEGVDIPSVTHALILASSKNPREFIQRRGRVLRQAPGKALAHVHDVIVLPFGHSEEQAGPTMLEGELARAITFGEDAVNPAVVSDLKSIAAQFGIDYATLVEDGLESDDE